MLNPMPRRRGTKHKQVRSPQTPAKTLTHTKPYGSRSARPVVPADGSCRSATSRSADLLALSDARSAGDRHQAVAGERGSPSSSTSPNAAVATPSTRNTHCQPHRPCTPSSSSRPDASGPPMTWPNEALGQMCKRVSEKQQQARRQRAATKD